MTVGSGANLMGGKTPAVGETYTVVIDPDTALEEIVDVSNYASGNTLTIARGIDGSTGVAHSAGAIVRHMVIGRDLSESNTHIEATTGHGATGAVVGTTNTQTLTNKTLTSPTITGTGAIAGTFTGNLTGNVTGTVSGNAGTVTNGVYTTDTGTVTSTMIANGTILNADINASAAIDKTKISGTAVTVADTGTVTSAMILDGTIVVGDIADGAVTSAKILDGTIVNADINAAAGIALSKLATDPLARANHTGTQAAATISDFDTQVRTSRLNQMATPNAAVSMNTQKLSDVATPTAGTDAANKTYVDTQVSNLVASAPGTLDTLNELATALGNDPSFATTITTSIGTKVAKAGDTMTGNLTMSSGAKVTGLPTPTVSSDAVPLTYVDTLYGSTAAAATSATNAATSAGAASTSATASAASASAASTSATAAAASATSAASSAASVNATATLATEFAQYGAEGSVLQNVPVRIPAAEQLLKQAVWWIDSAHSGSSGQAIKNLGWGGAALDATAGSSTAADSNDPKYLAWDGTNYVYGTGVTGNSISVPNAANLQITGDIDLRAQIAMDDWTPSTTMWFNYKIVGTTDGYAMAINPLGRIEMYINSVASPSQLRTSTVATGATDGSILWVRATLDADNGASGHDVKFFTSADGITWTQLGTTVTTAGVFTMGTATDVVSVTTNPFVGKMYRAQILNGIDGVPVLDVDTSVVSTGAATSFTALTGQTVTINRSTSGRKTTVVTHPVWLFGTDDYMEVNNRWLERTTANYLYLPGVASNYASAPDSAAISVTGDIDLRAKIALDDWTLTSNQGIIGKWSGGNRSYSLLVNSDGTLSIRWSADGSTLITKNSTVASGITDGATKWIRATLDVDNGASGNTVTFFTSDDGSTWTQLGSTVVTAGVTSIYDGAGNLEIGTVDGGTSILSRGKFFRAQVLNGIAGTVAFDANFESSITTNLPTTFTESSTNAATVTINYSGTGYRSAGVIASTYVFPGNPNTFKLSAYSLLDFGASDSFTLVAVARQWATPTNFGRIIDKGYGATAPGYALIQSGTSASFYSQINNGTNTANTSSTPSSIPAGAITSLFAVVNRTTNTLQSYSNTTGSTTASISTVGAIPVQTFPLTLGKRSDAAAGFADMELIGVAIFRTALTAAEITTLNSYFQGRAS
jgi:hypothetical protein